MVLEKFSFYFISVLFLKNIEVCAKAHGQIWSGRLQVTPWSAYLRDRDSRQATTLNWLGSSAPQGSEVHVRPQIRDGVVLEYIHSELRALPGWRLKQV